MKKKSFLIHFFIICFSLVRARANRLDEILDFSGWFHYLKRFNNVEIQFGSFVKTRIILVSSSSSTKWKTMKKNIFVIASYCSFSFINVESSYFAVDEDYSTLYFSVLMYSRFFFCYFGSRCMHIHRAHFEPLTIDIARRGEFQRFFLSAFKLRQRKFLTDHNLHNSQITMCALVLFDRMGVLLVSIDLRAFSYERSSLLCTENETQNPKPYLVSIKFLSDFRLFL